jgi:hypothetical protein
MSLLEVQAKMQAACQRAGRSVSDVRLVAVTKTHGLEEIREKVLRHGRFIIGESRVQEALPKMDELAGQGLEFHLIGPLQRNKAKFAVRFDMVQSVDSLRLAETLARKALEEGKVLPVLIELNLGREAQKMGFLEEELPEALPQIRGMEGLEVRGFMTIPPLSDDPETSRPLFAKLAHLADQYDLPERSMGMSGDFEVAIEEGATLVRVGRALFV